MAVTIGTNFSIFAVICVVSLNVVLADKFTALNDVEKILHAEHGIAHDLKDYIRNEEIRLEQLKRLANDFEEHSAAALENPIKHLGNPVNAFLLVKRFTVDWENVMNNLIVNNATEGFLSQLNDKAEFFPDNDDLSGAAQALLRLQDTYHLDTTKIATGDLQGIKQSPTMTSEDCFELGRLSYNNGDHYHSVQWMLQALAHYDLEDIKMGNRAVILDYLSFSTYMQGNPVRALNLTIEWLALEPDHIRAQNNKKYFEQMVQEEEEERRRKGDEEPFTEQFKNVQPKDELRSYKEFPIYEALCRGEETHEIPRKHELYCRNKHHHPIFYLAPLHEELINFDPFIAVYHDLLTDSELNKVKELAGPRLARSVVYHQGKNKAPSAQHYRTSKTAWLKDEEDPLIKRISVKASTLAGLTLETVEELQVVNYGIGGHYEPHYDFARDSENAVEKYGGSGNRIATVLFYPEEVTTFTEETGNRIATVIYYMTDVSAGGYTVFPEIGIKLVPKKGSCALWYNLKKDLQGDYRTRHAACPVLTGNKWICNKWFHERGQEFVRPCEEVAN